MKSVKRQWSNYALGKNLHYTNSMNNSSFMNSWRFHPYQVLFADLRLAWSLWHFAMAKQGQWCQFVRFFGKKVRNLSLKCFNLKKIKIKKSKHWDDTQSDFTASIYPREAKDSQQAKAPSRNTPQDFQLPPTSHEHSKMFPSTLISNSNVMACWPEITSFEGRNLSKFYSINVHSYGKERDEVYRPEEAKLFFPHEYSNCEASSNFLSSVWGAARTMSERLGRSERRMK